MANGNQLDAYEKKRETWALKEQGLSYTEIATRLHISSGEVIDRLYGWGSYRARFALLAPHWRRAYRGSTIPTGGQ